VGIAFNNEKSNRANYSLDGWSLHGSSRELWVTVGKAHDVVHFAFYFTTTLQLCLHNDAVRALGGSQIGPSSIECDFLVLLTDR
jgi:hypothetical protein